MALTVSDSASNRPEQIANAAEVLRTSKQRREVFKAIYKSKKQPKNLQDIQTSTSLSEVRILQLVKDLEDEHLIQVKIDKKDKRRVYYKVPFVNKNRVNILNLAENKKKLDSFSTKSKPVVHAVQKVKLFLPKKIVDIKMITIDDIESFKKVRNIDASTVSIKPIIESDFKSGIQKILGETGVFTDWGGEKNDLHTTHFRLDKKRTAVAFAFKGKGKTIKTLRIKDMGKNGDQIPRLFQSTSLVYLLQYWSYIDESVLELMEQLAIAKSATQSHRIYYGVIDGIDSQRIITAYAEEFK